MSFCLSFFFYNVSNNYTALRWKSRFYWRPLSLLVLGSCSSSRYNQFALRHFFWCFCYHCKSTGPVCYGMSKLLLSWYLIIRDEKLISDAVAVMWSRHSGVSLSLRIKCEQSRNRITTIILIIIHFNVFLFLYKDNVISREFLSMRRT